MAATKTAPPMLSAGETVEAGAFAPFAEADCRDLSIGALVSTTRAVIASGDRPMMFAYSRFLKQRAQLSTGAIGQYRPDPETVQKNELRKLLSVINAKLANPDVEPVHRRAADLVIRAGGVKQEATARERDAFRQSHPFPFQTKGDVRRW